MVTKPAKAHYTEIEVAAELGVSIEELRSLIRMHIVGREEDINHSALLTFQPSDLLLLRLLASEAIAEAPQG